MQGSVGMHASVPRQPKFSDTPILQPATPTGRCRGSERAPVPQKEHGFPARQYYQLEPRIRQLLAPQAALPIAAGLLLLLNHYDAVWTLIRHVGVIDCIALSCLAMSVILAAPHLMVMLSAEGSNASHASSARLPEMADNIATLSSAVRLMQQDPAPRHWLDMYYNLCSDVDNLLQEMSKVRKLMAEANTDVDHVKDKTAWIRKAHKK